MNACIRVETALADNNWHTEQLYRKGYKHVEQLQDRLIRSAPNPTQVKQDSLKGSDTIKDEIKI